MAFIDWANQEILNVHTGFQLPSSRRTLPSSRPEHEGKNASSNTSACSLRPLIFFVVSAESGKLPPTIRISIPLVHLVSASKCQLCNVKLHNCCAGWNFRARQLDANILNDWILKASDGWHTGCLCKSFRRFSGGPGNGQAQNFPKISMNRRVFSGRAGPGGAGGATPICGYYANVDLLFMSETRLDHNPNHERSQVE